MYVVHDWEREFRFGRTFALQQVTSGPNLHQSFQQDVVVFLRINIQMERLTFGTKKKSRELSYFYIAVKTLGWNDITVIMCYRLQTILEKVWKKSRHYCMRIVYHSQLNQYIGSNQFKFKNAFVMSYFFFTINGHEMLYSN